MKWINIQEKTPSTGMPLVLLDRDTGEMRFGVNRCVKPDCYLEELGKQGPQAVLDIQSTHYIELPDNGSAT